MVIAYHEPVFRPPSEAHNLILQATVGCRYNRCTFCSMYTDKTYGPRPVAEVIADMEAAAAAWPETHRVFLADGDAFTLPTDHLHTLLQALAARFPALQRVSCYATPADVLKKSPEELATLRAAGLRLIYLGVETGDPALLRRIRKGVTAEGLEKALTRARTAGLKVSATVILGLAGRHGWQDHVDHTAAVINAAPPPYLSTLQLFLTPAAEAPFREAFGTDPPFVPQDDSGILAEQERFLQALTPPHPVIFRSNHASNALALAGTLPRDRERLVATVAAARAGSVALRPLMARSL